MTRNPEAIPLLESALTAHVESSFRLRDLSGT